MSGWIVVPFSDARAQPRVIFSTPAERRRWIFFRSPGAHIVHRLASNSLNELDSRSNPSFTQLASGNWRVQVRRKTRYVADTFYIDRNGSSKPRALWNVRTFGDLIDLYDQDMREVGKPPRRSKAAVMEALKDALGTVKLPQLNRERLIEFGRKRARCRPRDACDRLVFIRTIISHAAAVSYV